MQKAYAYYRYSSHNQDDGNSISAQQNSVRAFAKANNIRIVSEYIDKAKTGTNIQRDGYQKMLTDLEKNPNVKCIVVHVLDRIHRNAREQLNMIYEFKAKGIKILTTSGIDTMDEECMSEILDEACLAEKYSRRLSKETRKGLMVNAEQAIHNGGRIPYGFRLGTDRHLEIDEAKSAAVRKIFEMYSAGLSYKKIIKWLDDNGYKTMNNSSFKPSTIKSMLENEKYCGTYFWDKSAAKDYRGKRNSYKKKESYIQIKDGWLADQGIETESLEKKSIQILLEDADEEVKTVLQLYQQLSKSSVKKYNTMLDTICEDNRARGMFSFYGASRTGRFAGRHIQLQNLPQNHLDHLAELKELVKSGHNKKELRRPVGCSLTTDKNIIHSFRGQEICCC